MMIGIGGVLSLLMMMMVLVGRELLWIYDGGGHFGGGGVGIRLMVVVRRGKRGVDREGKGRRLKKLSMCDHDG